MKKLVSIGIVCLLSIVGAVSVFANPSVDPMRCDDLNAQYYLDALGTMAQSGPGVETLDSPIGDVLWQYTVSGGFDNSPKAIRSIPDVTDDGVDDVAVASEDYYVRCLDGVTGDMVWEHEIYPGPVYLQNGLVTIPDVDDDGYTDLVAAATGGARLIRCISGHTGLEIWTHDTHEYGDGGWVYQVDAQCDYNDDGVNDVLAITGDDSSGTGPKRVYCLNGLDGISIWECYLDGPGFAVTSIADCTGDGVPDALAGCSNDAESDGYARAIDGATGSILWSFPTPGSSVWALAQIDDIDGDNVPDVAIGDFLGSGDIYGISAATGEEQFFTAIGSLMVLQLERISDVNDDGHADIIPGHTNEQAVLLDGVTGEIVWTHPVADQCWHVAVCSDVSGDSIDDVLVGTLYMDNFVYFLDGTLGTDLFSTEYGEAVDALSSISDVDGDFSMEMVAGGRDGTVTCFAGGPNASMSGIFPDFTADVTDGTAPLSVNFTDLSVAINTTITTWYWDFNGDGLIDSNEKNPLWTYNDPGVYTVSLMITDGTQTKIKTKVDYITARQPTMALGFGAVSGGIARVTVKLKNLGTSPLTASWNLSLTGGFVLKRSFGDAVDLPSNGSQVLVASPILGFGRVSVKVTAQAPGVSAIEKSASALVLGVFVIVR